MTILLAGGGTGGHVFPLLAVADALRAIEPKLGIVFVGTPRGLEKREVPARGYELELMNVDPIRGTGALGAMRGAASAVSALSASRALLRRHAPRVVCSIGGYAAGPIALAARSARIPLTLIEPNSVMGLSNRLIAPLVQRAYTAFADVERHLKPAVVRRTGVPLRSGFTPKAYRRDPSALSILILGGSQGARALNEAVPAALAQVELPLRIVHQAGKEIEQVRDRYAATQLSNVRVVPFIDDMPQALEQAELVIGRSGAGTVAEVCAVGRPSLLIPYPYAAGDHQRKNAEALAAHGAAVWIPSALATPERMAREVTWLAERQHLSRLAERAQSFGRPDAARRVAEDLLEIAGLRAEPDRSVA